MNPAQLIAKYQPLIAFLDTQEGCPKVPGYVDYEDMRIRGIMYQDAASQSDQNPAAALDSLTVWAMRVYWWACSAKIYTVGLAAYSGQTPEEWMLDTLTAICQALGWEGEG